MHWVEMCASVIRNGHCTCVNCAYAFEIDKKSKILRSMTTPKVQIFSNNVTIVNKSCTIVYAKTAITIRIFQMTSIQRVCTICLGNCWRSIHIIVLVRKTPFNIHSFFKSRAKHTQKQTTYIHTLYLSRKREIWKMDKSSSISRY